MAIKSFFEQFQVRSSVQSADTTIDFSTKPQMLAQRMEDHLTSIQRRIDSDAICIIGNPVIKCDSPFIRLCEANRANDIDAQAILTEADVAKLAMQLDIHAWVPEKIFPGVFMKSPSCKSKASGGRWCRAKILHGLDQQRYYITKEYICYKCMPASRSNQSERKARIRKQKQFQADSPEALAVLPAYVRQAWQFTNSGKIICEAGVIDYVRALATRTSWSAIADTINELKELAWERNTITAYSMICSHMGLQCNKTNVKFPKDYRLSAEWIRNVYVSDAKKREAEVRFELTNEIGDDVLAMDWTIDAASRCNGECLFNVMDGNRRILMSSLTKASSPREVQPLLMSLKQRGVEPKVIYVDKDCCGIWREIITKIWPAAVVKLDGMHAIKRLTRTASTQHPWHGRFCAALSNAIYTYDIATMKRLASARKRQGLQKGIPNHAKSKYVPRVIENAEKISNAIENILEQFTGKHPIAGPLLTSETMSAWFELKGHILSDCLCDPSGMTMNKFGDEVCIGGEYFRTVRTSRGASALEGFHNHQKQWLGCLARHAADAGAALLADGAVRWNRKRRRDIEED